MVIVEIIVLAFKEYLDQLVEGKKTGEMIYERTELISNRQYYFYLKSNGKWEFTWDVWMNLASVDFDNFGDCKFENRLKI